MKYEIWECTQAQCGFRFPIGADEAQRVAWKDNCPRCDAPVQVCGRYDAAGEESNVHNSPQARIESGAAHGSFPFLFHALLDNIRSAWNVGAMLRTADGAGIQHIYLCGITAAAHHSGVVAAALGAHKIVSSSSHANALHTAQALKQQGWQLWALECGLSGAHPPAYSLPEAVVCLRELAGESPNGLQIVLVVGNERYGVDPQLVSLCDAALSIPMLGRKGSLNAAIAFGVAAYSLRFGGL